MFWLSFVYPRSHPGWIGPIGEIGEAAFILQQAYRYSILSFPDLHSIWTKRVAFLMPVHTSRIGWLDFCMFWLGFVSQSVRVTCLFYLLTVLLTWWLIWLYLIVLWCYFPVILLQEQKLSSKHWEKKFRSATLGFEKLPKRRKHNSLSGIGATLRKDK